MKNIFKNLTKVLLLLIVLVVTIFTGSNVVSANEIPKTLSLGNSTNLPVYINGLNIPTKNLTNGTPCYCLTRNKQTTMNTTVTLYGERDSGLSYIIENGYPNKSITGDKNKDTYITQYAVWMYLDETTGSTNLNSYIRYTASDPYNIRGMAKNLVDGAIKAKANGYKEPKISASVNTNSLKIGKTKKYYISDKVVVNTKDLDTYKVSLNNALDGTVITDENGVVKNEFKSGESFIVLVPVTSVKDTLVSFTVNITGSTTFNKVYEYRPSNSSFQNVTPAYLYPTTKSVNTSLKFDIFKSKVSITKIDLDTNKQLAGATLVLKDANGNVVTTWVTTGGAHIIENLPKGTYYLQETKAPLGYDLNTKEQKFTITDTKREFSLKLYNKHSEKSLVKIIKLDKETNKPVSGAKLLVKDTTGKEVANFVSTNDYYVIENLPNGTYTVEETEAPSGYILDKTPQKFTISDNNKKAEIKLYNNLKPRYVTIEKVDQDTGNILVGARLVVKDTTGKEVANFLTTNKPYVLENIKDGTYTLQEISAPDGYILNNQVVTFTIDSSRTSYKITFKNKKAPTVTVPDTGSNASVILYIIGGLILTGTLGVAYIYANKR